MCSSYWSFIAPHVPVVCVLCYWSFIAPHVPVVLEDLQMAGLEGMTAKDKRVIQNNALKEWMGENGVWVFDRSDWGVAPHALSVAVGILYGK